MKRSARDLLEAACYADERGDHRAAMRLYRSSAKLGNVEAQVNLANKLDEGAGTGNFQRARYWYAKAIRKGSAEAAFNLAVSYRQRGSRHWAQFWFKRAHEMGDEDALEEMARLPAVERS